MNKKNSQATDFSVVKVEDLGDKKTTIFYIDSAMLAADDLGPVMPVLLGSAAVDSLLDSGRVIASLIGPITNVISDSQEDGLAALANHLGISVEDAQMYAPLHSTSIDAKTGPLGEDEVLQIVITPAKTAEDRVRGDVSGAPTLVLSDEDRVVGALVAEGKDLSLIIGKTMESGALRLDTIVTDKQQILQELKAGNVYPDELPAVTIAIGGNVHDALPVFRLVVADDSTNAPDYTPPASRTLLVHNREFPDVRIAATKKYSRKSVEDIAAKGSGGVYRASDTPLPVQKVDTVCITELPFLYGDVSQLDHPDRPEELPHQNAQNPPSKSSLSGQRVYIGVPMKNMQLRVDAAKAVRILGGQLVISPANAQVVVVSDNAPVEFKSTWPSNIVKYETLLPF